MDPILVLLVVLASPLVFVVARAVFGRSVTVDELLQRPDLAWPRGVQEEEPVRWRTERLVPITARRAAARHAGR